MMNSARVSISPDTIKDIARLSTLATPGVVGLADSPANMLQRAAFKGVEVTMVNEIASISLHVTATTDQSLMALGNQIKHNVAEAVAEIAGIKIESINVAFEDVRTAK